MRCECRCPACSLRINTGSNYPFPYFYVILAPVGIRCPLPGLAAACCALAHCCPLLRYSSVCLSSSLIPVLVTAQDCSLLTAISPGCRALPPLLRYSSSSSLQAPRPRYTHELQAAVPLASATRSPFLPAGGCEGKLEAK